MRSSLSQQERTGWERRGSKETESVLQVGYKTDTERDGGLIWQPGIVDLTQSERRERWSLFRQPVLTRETSVLVLKVQAAYYNWYIPIGRLLLGYSLADVVHMFKQVQYFHSEDWGLSLVWNEKSKYWVMSNVKFCYGHDVSCVTSVSYICNVVILIPNHNLFLHLTELFVCLKLFQIFLQPLV